MSKDFGLSEEFSTFFEDVVRSVNGKPDEYYLSDTGNLSYPVKTATKNLKAIQMFNLLSKIFQQTRIFSSLTLMSLIYL